LPSVGRLRDAGVALLRRVLVLVTALPALSVAWSCVLVVHPEPRGTHCAPSGATTECMACLVAKCQEAVDGCCFPGQCGNLLSTLEQCTTAHDASCTQARARTTSGDASESRLATCLQTRCGSLCSERTGTSKTSCGASLNGESTCTCTAGDATNDVECSEAVYPSSLCCASSGWPGPGLACTCVPIVCVPSGSGCFCSRNEYATPGYQSRCGGKNLFCCRTNGTCRCGTAACEPGLEESVPECGRATMQCDVAHTEVASCSLRE
jgi:hypothetical protein